MDKLLLFNQFAIVDEAAKNDVRIEFTEHDKFSRFSENLSEKIYKNIRLFNYFKSIEAIEYELDIVNKKRVKTTTVSKSISTLDGTPWEEKYKKLLKYQQEYYGVLGTGYALSWCDKLFGDDLKEITFTFPNSYSANKQDSRFSSLLGKRFFVDTPNSNTVGFCNTELLKNFDDDLSKWMLTCGPNVIYEYSDSTKQLSRVISPQLPREKIEEILNFDFVSKKFVENYEQLMYPHEETKVCLIFDVKKDKIDPKILFQISNEEYISKVTETRTL